MLASQKQHIDSAIKVSSNVGLNVHHLFSGSEDKYNFNISGNI